ncbi:MAG: hypothetical protein EOP45_11065 [Sphingobacteriaceae bacterium]|nr:MAG: hypothetical protein EOP45_11065 [Sphingobacteriaceae bacterium]
MTIDDATRTESPIGNYVNDLKNYGQAKKLQMGLSNSKTDFQDTLYVVCTQSTIYEYNFISQKWSMIQNPAVSTQAEVKQVLFSWLVTDHGSLQYSPCLILGDSFGEVTLYNIETQNWLNLASAVTWRFAVDQEISSMIISENSTQSTPYNNSLAVGLSKGEVSILWHENYRFVAPTPSQYNYYYKKEVDSNLQTQMPTEITSINFEFQAMASFLQIKNSIDHNHIVIAVFHTTNPDLPEIKYYITGYTASSHLNTNYDTKLIYYQDQVDIDEQKSVLYDFADTFIYNLQIYTNTRNGIIKQTGDK